jgi:addiction module HigA family antidote
MIDIEWTVHPGEVLREEFLKPLSITPYRLAKEIHVPVPRINEIVLERRGITADTALRLAKFFDTTPQFWMNLQDTYEVRCALKNSKADIDSIKVFRNGTKNEGNRIA